MKTIKSTLGIVAISFAILTAQSCGNQEKPANETIENGHDNSDGHHDMDGESSHHEGHAGHDDTMETSTSHEGGDLISTYLNLKNSLVSDNETEAKKNATLLVGFISNYDASSFTKVQQKEIAEILETSKEHAEHIAKSPIAHQREHFKELSVDMIDLVAITGTETTLYEQYCPMYDNNKGGTWLSSKAEVENPYFGQKMLSCGKMQKEIN